MRSFWEGLDHYGFNIDIDYQSQQLPREHDMLLIILWESLGIKGDDLVSLNRCRIVWGLLFLSDIVGANGRHVEAHKLAPQG